MTITTLYYEFMVSVRYVLRPPGFAVGDSEGTMDRKWADDRRDKTLTYMKQLFSEKAKFVCIARDDKPGESILRGYVHLKSPCSESYLRRLLGVDGVCKPSYLGDAVNLCILLHVDRDLFVAGRLPQTGANSVGRMGCDDPHYVIKKMLEDIDGKDEE